jgi:hypothetical protein
MTAIEKVLEVLGRPLSDAEQIAYTDAVLNVRADFEQTYDPSHCPEPLDTLESCEDYGDYPTEGENVAFHVAHRHLYREMWGRA